jgi:hypothetical protein
MRSFEDDGHLLFLDELANQFQRYVFHHQQDEVGLALELFQFGDAVIKNGDYFLVLCAGGQKFTFMVHFHAARVDYIDFLKIVEPDHPLLRFLWRLFHGTALNRL